MSKTKKNAFYTIVPLTAAYLSELFLELQETKSWIDTLPLFLRSFRPGSKTVAIGSHESPGYVVT